MTHPQPAVASRTGFARRVLALTLPYFRSRDRWKARGLLAAIVGLNLAAVYMLVLINDWNRLFYDALQNKDQAVFWQQLLRFSWLAGLYIVIAVYRFYLTQLLEVRWRAWMTHDLLARWLGERAFYRLELARFAREGAQPDNPDQRIQEDLNLFTSYSVSLSMGLLNAVVTLVSFVGILWSLSGAFSFSWDGSTYSIPGFMVWMALVYCIAGSLLTHLIGRPLTGLNFRQQRVEADFRHHLIRVREYSEAIALDRGEAVERQQLNVRFGQVLANYLRLLRAQKRLTWFTNGFGQAAVVFPFIVAAPRFFSGSIQLGELMQIASAFGRVQDALSWFVDNYDRLASWRATTERLTGFEDALTASRAALSTAHPADTVPPQSAVVSDGVAGTSPPRAHDLSVSLPDGTPLLAGLDLQVRPGQHVVVRGPSGSGKSSLFRSLAGIWPFARGRVELPDEVRFIPQRPYLPIGRLRDALAYPEPATRFDDEALRQALSDALLPDLVHRLDEHAAWDQQLSGGEQQRLALARVFLRRPRWVFADEATSALDEASEQTLYTRLRERVEAAGGALISIAHRPAVARFHPLAWTFEAEPAAPGAGRARYRVREEAAAW